MPRSGVLFGLAVLLSLMGSLTAEEPARILLLLGEHEYGTTDTLPEFARGLEAAGHQIDIVAAPTNDRSDPRCHEFPGLSETLDRADLLVVSTRRRFLPESLMLRLQRRISEGMPVLGIRTASHAFAARRSGEGYVPGPDQAAWNDFDRQVFGAYYHGHSRNEDGPTVLQQPLDMRGHPLMAGIDGAADGPTTSTLYYMRNLDAHSRVLITGRSADAPISHEPVSWTRDHEGRRSFYTSLGDESHFSQPWFRTHLLNAIQWLVASPTEPVATDAAFLEKDYEASGEGLGAEASLAGMITPDDLTVDLLKSEPAIQQPVFLRFDDRGRMWVVEYRQYPNPAGLTLVSRDQYWRNVYDRKPAPPGHPDFVPGADRITIHEDRDGDGAFEHSKVFVDGLNLATAAVSGPEGVWVLQPPYLLFYPDRDQDDTPDGDPEVILDGFGIQDTHAVVSSLGWGPDGWLYAAQGSTVTSDVTVTGSTDEPVSRVGQLMWRFHPDTRRYEVFAEGGGNIWSSEFDSKGRLFAGTNDRYPAYAYRQGAFYRKNFGKHGALSNPHAYDYFFGINAPGHRRVSTSVLIYEGARLPQRYDEALLYLGVLQGKVGAYDLSPAGLNFSGQSIDLPLNAADRWFRPVYIELGPDGAVYVCDWYDQQVNHYRNHEGAISKLDGRIFRIRGQSDQPMPSFDLSDIPTHRLVDLLYYQNRWWRDAARRQLRHRTDRAETLPRLQHMLESETRQPALEALWAINLISPEATKARLTGLRHVNPHVRRWSVRLVGDKQTATAAEFHALRTLAMKESNLEVLGQIASSAARLDEDLALELFEQLIRNPSSQNQPHLDRMIWWGIEPFYAASPASFGDWFLELAASSSTDLSADLASFVMRRFVSDGTPVGFDLAKRLWATGDDPRLLQAFAGGFEAAMAGRSLATLPQELITELGRHPDAPLSLRLRVEPTATLSQALAVLESESASLESRQQILAALAELRLPESLPTLIDLLSSPDPALVVATLHALQGYADAAVAEAVIDRFEDWPNDVRDAAETLLVSRPTWGQRLMQVAISTDDDSWQISSRALADLRTHEDPELTALVDQYSGESPAPVTDTFDEEITRVTSILQTRGGSPQAGWTHYQQRCAACHQMFDDGGNVGPDLTAYQRDQLDSLLLAIVHPDAEIREGFEMTTIETNDGRVLSGFLTRQDDQGIAIQLVGGAEIALPHEQIKRTVMQSQSLMPAGLLSGLDDQALRDLFAFLQIRQPLDIRP